MLRQHLIDYPEVGLDSRVANPVLLLLESYRLVLRVSHGLHQHLRMGWMGTHMRLFC